MPFHDTKGPPPRVWGIEEMFASAETGLPAVPVQDIDLHGLRFRPEYNNRGAGQSFLSARSTHCI